MKPFVSFLISLMIMLFDTVNGQERHIHHFDVVETLTKNDKLAVIATDSAGQPQENIQGTFQFTVNGFKHDLAFEEGVAVVPQPMEKSAFVFIKHVNQAGSNGKLFYVYKSNSGIRPIHIPWYYLIIVPLLIIFIAYLFKRLLIFAVLLLIGLFIFNYSKGLDFSNLIETLTHGIRSLTGS